MKITSLFSPGRTALAAIGLVQASLLHGADTDFSGAITEIGLYSEVLEEERDIIVRLPLDYSYQKDATYPVLYVLDGAIQTSQTAGTISYLHRYYQIPDMIMVAIRNTDRSRDMTPSARENFESAGGASRFLAFIEGELMPFIDRNYRSNGYNMLAGHSLGGLFVFHTLLEAPELFQARFAFSPSLWWDPDNYFPALVRFFDSRPEIESFLYTNLGTESEVMTPPFQSLRVLLEDSAPKGLIWHAREQPEEVHVTTPVIGQFQALRLLFAEWPLPTTGEATERETLLSHYLRLSDRLGYEVLPGERIINATANQLFQFQNEPALARELLSINLEIYPESPHAYALMAEFAQAEKDFEAALSCIDRALAVIEPDDEYFSQYDQQRAKITGELSARN